jgi:hypothetical protein
MKPYTDHLYRSLLATFLFLNVPIGFTGLAFASVSSNLPPCKHALRVLLASARGSSPADSTEARTLRKGVAQRRLAEPVDSFLVRVLPVSYTYFGQPLKATPYTWRPSSFGKQLFFTAHDKAEYYRLFLFIIDPFQPAIYAVERFELELPESDTPEELATFFADVNQDGQKELLVLVNSRSREPIEKDTQYEHVSHYHTCIYGYRAAAGDRPRYEEYPSRPYLDDLATAAQVRQALTDHQRVRKLPQHK